MRALIRGCLTTSIVMGLVGCGGGDGGANIDQKPPSNETQPPLVEVKPPLIEVQPPSPANAAPTANAGPAQSVFVGSTVTLNGSGSSDTDGDHLTFNWSLTSKPAGSGAVLTSPTTVKPAFTADLPGVYVASLIVSDGKASSSVATVSVTTNGFGAIPVFDARVIDNAELRAIGDFNGDGRPDLIAEVPGATSFEQPKAYIYRQELNGQFSKVPLSIRVPSGSTGVADFDRDGRADLVSQGMDGSCAFSVLFFSQDLLSFNRTQGLSSGTCGDMRPYAVDFDGDGNTDIFPLGTFLSLAHLGTGTQSFTPLQIQPSFALQGIALAVDDLDGDGVVDVLTANSFHAMNQVSISVAYGAGAGTYGNVKNWIFPNVTFGFSHPSGPAFVADFNNDGLKDILYCPGNSCQLTLADGPQSFESTPKLVDINSMSLAVVDINGDGNQDVVSSTFEGVKLRLGDGKGNFSDEMLVPESVGFSPYMSFRVADVNKDGKQDLVLTSDRTLRVFTRR